MTFWCLADTDVPGELSGSAMSAEAEFQVDAFGALTLKENPLSQNLHSINFNLSATDFFSNFSTPCI